MAWEFAEFDPTERFQGTKMTNSFSVTSAHQFSIHGVSGPDPQFNSQTSSAEIHSAGVELQVPGPDGERRVEITTASNQSLATATAQQTSVFKKAFARVAGGVLGAARAVLTFLWSPVTALKYLIIALAQACRGEFKKAGKALALALTAPLWTALDGFMKTYARFAAWGDDGEFCDPREEDNWLERQKASAKEDVVTEELQHKLNYGFVNVLCDMRP